MVLSNVVFHVLAVRLGKSDQDLCDDLVMGLIPPIPILAAPLTATPEVEGSSKLPGVS